MFSQLISESKDVYLLRRLSIVWLILGGGDGSSYMRWMEDEEDGGGLERGLDLLFAGQ